MLHMLVTKGTMLLALPQIFDRVVILKEDN